MSSKRILVITDNSALKAALEEIIAESSDLKACDWTYRHSPASVGLDGGDKFKAIDVKKEIDEIVGCFDLVISLHCKQLFPERLVRTVRCINVHPGYNPHNRGWFPQVFAILNGLPHGATIHEMDALLDHGGIIARQQVRLHSWDTSLTAYEKVIKAELALLREWLPKIVSHDYKPQQMEHAGNLNLIKDFRALCPLDLQAHGTFKEFYDKLRALSHEPYWNAYFVDEKGCRVYVRLQTMSEQEQSKEQPK